MIRDQDNQRTQDETSGRTRDEASKGEESHARSEAFVQWTAEGEEGRPETTEDPQDADTRGLASMASVAVGRAHFSELAFPEFLNHYATMMGGRSLDLMDRAAFVAASRLARRTLVTAGVEQVRFLAPINEGELVEVRAEARHDEGRRYRVVVVVEAEHLLTGERRTCVEGVFFCVEPRMSAAPSSGFGGGGLSGIGGSGFPDMGGGGSQRPGPIN